MPGDEDLDLVPDDDIDLRCSLAEAAGFLLAVLTLGLAARWLS